MGKSRNKLRFIILTVFAVSLLSLSMLPPNAPPEIQTSVIISPITEEEFNRVAQSSVSGEIRIEDFKKLTIKVDIFKSISMKSREIFIPDVYYIIDHYDKVRSCMGGEYRQNNVGKEDFAKSSKYVVFYARGLTKNDYSKIFNNLNIIVSGTLSNGEMIRTVFPINDWLEFKS